MIPASRTPRASHEQRTAYVLLRLLLGVDLLGHGFIRILHGTSAFAAGMVKMMADTPLPAVSVSLFGHALPWIELTLGTLLVLGLFTRWALTAAMLLMIALMIGVTLKQEWSTAGLQLGYGFVLFALLFVREANDASWPDLLFHRSPGA